MVKLGCFSYGNGFGMGISKVFEIHLKRKGIRRCGWHTGCVLSGRTWLVISVFLGFLSPTSVSSTELAQEELGKGMETGQCLEPICITVLLEKCSCLPIWSPVPPAGCTSPYTAVKSYSAILDRMKVADLSAEDDMTFSIPSFLYPFPSALLLYVLQNSPKAFSMYSWLLTHHLYFIHL